MDSRILAVVAQRHHPAEVVPWQDGASNLVTCGTGDPVLLAEYLASLDSSGLAGVVLFARRESGHEARLMATVANGALPGLHTALVLHSSTALGVATAAMLAHQRQLAPGAFVEHVTQVLAQSPQGVVLSSVARLDHPQPSFVQHLRSLLPLRPPFVAWLDPEARVETLDRKAPVVRPEGSAVLVEQSPEVALPDFGGLDVQPVPTVCRTRAEYGAKGAEFVVLPRELVEQPAPRSCRSCRARLAAEFCPTCHVTTQLEERA